MYIAFVRSLLLASGLLLPLVGLAQAGSDTSLAETLKANRWQKRVLLLCAASSDQPALKQQQTLLAQDKAGLQERDMLVLDLVTTEMSTADKQFLRQKLGIAEAPFTAVLIGKDGGIKRKDTAPITPQRLFGTIDTMPMRRQEAKGKKP
ncbi:DUF4174 domain-containing protein [Hymenobacter jejuensis]|uniref:DUF4174 domain-containing protein n=1 Tax=Hymenobacter jejuensis TaxID=2502781 RepID=A0A5B8A128_9BACT|nr:DUF4174 domain-containing protein [Hymenobacter jejuensis]QDA60998.1 DUF4174 domain-containing protein [Hymenobacter jejuensis]